MVLLWRTNSTSVRVLYECMPVPIEQAEQMRWHKNDPEWNSGGTGSEFPTLCRTIALTGVIGGSLHRKDFLLRLTQTSQNTYPENWSGSQSWKTGSGTQRALQEIRIEEDVKTMSKGGMSIIQYMLTPILGLLWIPMPMPGLLDLIDLSYFPYMFWKRCRHQVGTRWRVGEVAPQWTMPVWLMTAEVVEC